jgi:BlaI family penicillinase repressor
VRKISHLTIDHFCECEYFRTMSPRSQTELSRRERQIMDIIYAAGEASAATVLERMENPPGYSTVRTLLQILVEKGHLKNRQEDGRYIYEPIHVRAKAGRSAMSRVLDTFYDGSLERAVAAMLEGRDGKLSGDEIERLGKLIDQARKEGR